MRGYKLPARHAAAIIRRHALGESLSSLASAYHVDKTTVCNVLRRARRACECCESADYTELVWRDDREQRMCAECAALSRMQDRLRRRRYTAEISLRAVDGQRTYGGVR